MTSKTVTSKTVTSGRGGRPRGWQPSWLNRIEAQFQALRYFTLDGTDHRSPEEQNSMIRRYIAWRNRNAHDKNTA